jgi:hypothetical protein
VVLMAAAWASQWTCGGCLQVAGDAEGLLQQARSADPSSPEPLQALASLQYEQGNSEEALQLLKQSMKLWFRRQGSSDEEDDDDDDDDGDEEIPEAEVSREQLLCCSCDCCLCADRFALYKPDKMLTFAGCHQREMPGSASLSDCSVKRLVMCCEHVLSIALSQTD